MRLRVPLCGLFLTCVTFVTAQQREPLEAVQVATPPVIDGTIDPNMEWKDVKPFEGLWDDQSGQPAPMTGTFWLAYDKDFIYFAARLPDSDPKGIRAQEYRTNASLFGDDSVYLDIDLAGSLANFNTFGINSRGATDVRLAGGRAAKREWTGEFISKGRVTDTGWEAEAKIPWGIMQLPGSGVREVRFNVTRNYPRLSRQFAWAYTGNNNINNFGRWRGVSIPRIAVRPTLKLLPYTYLGHAEGEGFIMNSGLDLKTSFGEITAVGSINPDFRNIENQILSLDFSRFERLAGETRPFFLEGRDYLNTGIFASQRIPKFDVGLNLHGKITDKLSFGLLEAVDFGERNNVVGNFTYNTDPNNSYRVSYTSLNSRTVKNDAFLARSSHTFGPWNLFLRHNQTHDRQLGTGISQSLQASYNKDIFNSFFGYDSASPGYLPRLGFAPDRNYKGLYLGANIYKTYNTGAVQDWGLNAYADDYDRFGGGHYHRSANIGGNISLRNGIFANLSGNWEDFLGVDDKVYNFGIGFPRSHPKGNVFVNYSWGELAAQSYKSVSISAFYRPITKLSFTGSFQAVDHFNYSDQAIVGWNYDMGNDFYLSGRAVKRDKDWNAYLSFRRSGNRGIEYIFILGDPNAVKWRTSAVLKVVMPFELKF